MDTSGASSSAAVLRGGNLLAETTAANPRKQHCEGLMPMLDTCLNMAQIQPRDIDVIACTSGPGSFTGIRIGAAAAKGLAHALNIGIAAVPTLDALAYNVLDASLRIVPVMDARRGQVYTAAYVWEGGLLRRVGEYECVLLAQVLSGLGESGAVAVFTGDGVGVPDNAAAILAAGHTIAPANTRYVRASSVAYLALHRLAGGHEPAGYNDFTPFYLRKPQAQRELEEKQGVPT